MVILDISQGDMGIINLCGLIAFIFGVLIIFGASERRSSKKSKK
ncbi:MAG: membrane-bound ClpP family serine protease [Flavobacteriaceae bacterium]|jgi:membrane-bound ClpP family serine protease